MNTENKPVVSFPNMLNGVHQALLDLIAFTYHQNRLPDSLRHLYTSLPESFETQTESWAEVFNALAPFSKDLTKLGELPGIPTKHLLTRIAVGLFRRAIGCVRGLTEQVKSGDPKVAESRSWDYYSADLVNLTAILDSRTVFIAGSHLKEYLVALETLQDPKVAGKLDTAEAMCRKLRAITRPKAGSRPATRSFRRAPAVQAAAIATPAAVEATKVEEPAQPVTVAPEFADIAAAIDAACGVETPATEVAETQVVEEGPAG